MPDATIEDRVRRAEDSHWKRTDPETQARVDQFRSRVDQFRGQAERARALWPNRGEADTRPAVGAGYARLDAVAPKSPVVPDDAPAALRLPIVRITHPAG